MSDFLINYTEKHDSYIEYSCNALVNGLLEKDFLCITAVREKRKKQELLSTRHSLWIANLVDMVENILLGKHLLVTQLSKIPELCDAIPMLRKLSIEGMAELCAADDSNEIRKACILFLYDNAWTVNGDRGTILDEANLRIATCIIVGVAYLEIYTRANYTGPELTPLEFNSLYGANPATLDKTSLIHLECDGNYPYSTILLPHTLLIARVILATVSDYKRSLWTEGIRLDSDGNIFLPLANDICSFCSGNDTNTNTKPCLIGRCNSDEGSDELKSTISNILNSVDFLPSRLWWSGRAAVLHCRLLTSSRHDQLPSLWTEATENLLASILFHDKVFRRSIEINNTVITQNISGK